MSKYSYQYFNCSNEYEYDYIASFYSKKVKPLIITYLKHWNKTGKLNNITYEELHILIEQTLGIKKLIADHINN